MSRKSKKDNRRFAPIKFSGSFEKEHRESYKEIYKTTYSELVSQQDKRDTLVKTFVALIAFAVPFSFSESIGWEIRSFVFLGLAIIGLLFSFIVIRYREYKEAYWVACRTSAIVDNTSESRITKELIQAVYLYCLEKNCGKYVVVKNGKRKASLLKTMWKSIFSAETLYLIAIALISAVLFGLSFAFIFYTFYSVQPGVCWAIGAPIFAIVFFGLYFLYNFGIYKTYKAVEQDDKGEYSVYYFNFSFGKAWTLHTYYDGEETKQEKH